MISTERDSASRITRSQQPRGLDSLEPRMLLAADVSKVIADQWTSTELGDIQINLKKHFEDTSVNGTTVRFDTTQGTFYIELFDDTAPNTVANFLQYIDNDDYVNSFIHRSIPGFVIQGGGFTFDDGSGVGNVTSYGNVDNEFANFATVTGSDATVTQGSAVIQLPAGTDLQQVFPGDRIRLIGRTDGEFLSGSTTDFFEIASVDDANDTVTVLQTPSAASETVTEWFIVPPLNLTGTLAMAKQGGDPDSASNNFFVNLADTHDNLDIQNEGFTIFGRIIGQGMDTVNAIADLQRVNAGGAFTDLPVDNFQSGNSIVDANLVNVTDTDRDANINFDVNNALSFQVKVLSGASLVDASISNSGRLTLTPTLGRYGLAEVQITARGTDGSVATQTFTVQVVKPPASDFNDDGRGDLVVRNPGNGKQQVWLMDGGERIGTWNLPKQKGNSWVLSGVGDFTGDGNPDLVYSQTNGGKAQIWQMNKNKLVKKIKLPKPPTKTAVIAGVGDYDGKNGSDIWWRDGKKNHVWQMDGKKVQKTAKSNFKNGNWDAYGVSDLNNDGIDDMVFRKQGVGQNTIGYVKKFKVKTNKNTQTFAGDAWIISGSLDANEDGNNDILWRNRDTGETRFFMMNGATVQSVTTATLLDADDRWQLAGFVPA